MPNDKRMSDEGQQSFTGFKQECDNFVILMESMGRHGKKSDGKEASNYNLLLECLCHCLCGWAG
ncbi:MAG: hypothetical protein D3923_09435, partial [Candidatus Electrothrix sp. AR3]|nr:hypothetical protein [Candidatus Electrothrix sp. AR3]